MGLLIRAFLSLSLLLAASAQAKNQDVTEFIQLTADSVEVIRIEISENRVFWEELRDGQFEREIYEIQIQQKMSAEQKRALSHKTRAQITGGISVVVRGENGNSMHFLIGDATSGFRHLALQAMPSDYGEESTLQHHHRPIELVSLGTTTLSSDCAASLITTPTHPRRFN